MLTTSEFDLEVKIKFKVNLNSAYHDVFLSFFFGHHVSRNSVKSERQDNLGQTQNVLDRSPGKTVTYYKLFVQSAWEPPPTCRFYTYIYIYFNWATGHIGS